MQQVREGQRVRIAATSRRMVGYYGKARNLDSAQRTAYVVLTHKPDCESLDAEIPWRRLSWDKLEAGSC